MLCMCVCSSPSWESWISTVIHLANVPLSARVQPGMAIVHWANPARGGGTNVQTRHVSFWDGASLSIGVIGEGRGY